jgi:hypothetical protein
VAQFWQHKKKAIQMVHDPTPNRTGVLQYLAQEELEAGARQRYQVLFLVNATLV